MKENKRMIIINGTIITPFHRLRDRVILTEEGKIKAIINREEPGAIAQKGAEVIDAKDKFIVPGYIDIHVHGGGGSDVMDGNEEAINRMAVTHARFGTTAFLPTTMSMSKDKIIGGLRSIREARKNGTFGAEILGANLEGPYLNPEKKGAQKEEDIRKISLEEFLTFQQASGKLIRLITIAPEMPGAIDFIRYLCREGIIVSAGHTNATYQQMQAAVQAGLSHITHTFNAMRAFHHREPGVIGAALTSPELTIEVIADTVHVHPVALKILTRSKEAEKVVLITDAMRAAGLAAGTYDLGGQEVVVAGGQARLKDNTLAGSVLTMDRAVRNMVKEVGIPLAKAVQMASFNPAKSIGIENKKGSLEPGKDADMVILDKNLAVEATMVAGKIVYRRREI